jgi:hypothetical protein
MSSSGREAWLVSVETALTMAYGSKGIPLSYVIRANAAQSAGNATTWEQLAVNGAPLDGLDYVADNMTVHLFLLNNVGGESDAYAYIQPLLSRSNGRADMLALRERYENDAMVQTRVNEANRTWELPVYKNEQAMTFESFCRKLQKALQHFERAN